MRISAHKVILLAVAVAAVSCEKRGMSDAGVPSGDVRICYSAGISSDMSVEQTKASTVVTENFADAYGSFVVSAFKPDSPRPEFFRNCKVQWKDGEWVPEKEYFWQTPLSEVFRFIAFSPIDAEGMSDVEYVMSSGLYRFDFTYTTPHSDDGKNDAVVQRDILVANTPWYYDLEEEGTDTVKLAFNHVLSAIQFKVDKIGADIRIDSIAIRSMYDSVKYSWYATSDSPNVSNFGTMSDFVQVIDRTVGVDLNEGDIINDGERTFILPPQSSYCGNAKLEFFITEDEPMMFSKYFSDLGLSYINTGDYITMNVSIQNKEILVDSIEIDPWVSTGSVKKTLL